MQVRKMRNIILRFCLNAIFVITGFLLVFPSPVKADGGPILTDPELWGLLKEGQQTAVITLKGDGTAGVDLFVSMLDSSGQSHEVVFFIPLGIAPSDFSVIERTSLDFDRELTEELDQALRDEVYNRRNVRLSMLPASAVINGGWMLVAWYPVLLSGCAQGEAPEASYETESSKVDIYGLDEDTNLYALINTTGLDSSVKETLSRLRGQRIAIVTLQTQPPLAGGEGSGSPLGQPGIHLSWTASLTRQSATAAYSYPLGTGSSWANPVEMTRVYVVAPHDIDFTVQYPELGAEHSGFTQGFFGVPEPNILRYDHISAYAIDEAWNSSGHIWRGIYTQSNSAEDIIVSVGSSSGFLSSLRRVLVGWGTVPNLIIGLLIALALWVVAWRYIMPRMVEADYNWRSPRLWRESLIYPAINTVAMLVAALIVGIPLLILGSVLGIWTVASLLLVAIIMLPVIFTVPGTIYLLRKQWLKFNVTRGQAFKAYITVSLVANLAYLALAFGYTALIGVL
jgi:hypothetical protein